MNWIDRSRWYRQSECGQYRISKAGAPGDVVYTAWARHGDAWSALLYTPDLREAERACESHPAPHLPRE